MSEKETEATEIEAALRASPMASNRFYAVLLDNGVLRLAFGETLNQQTRYHQAVRLDPSDAVALRDLLVRLYPLAPAVV